MQHSKAEKNCLKDAPPILHPLKWPFFLADAKIPCALFIQSSKIDPTEIKKYVRKRLNKKVRKRSRPDSVIFFKMSISIWAR